MTERTVVLLVGPPGAGKTTTARASGLLVYDRDDPHWQQNERAFRAALTTLGHDPEAQAVVIRAGASTTARQRSAHVIRPTHVYMLTSDRATLEQRVAHRDQHRRRSLAAIGTWFDRHDRDDEVPDFPGWDALTDRLPPPGLPIRLAGDPGPSPGW